MIKILIVEDEALVAMALQRELGVRGFACIVAATAESAVALAIAELPDIVLMDIRLTGERDGIGAAREIRRSTTIPICFVSGYYKDDVSLSDLGFEPTAFLQKPVSADAIAKIIFSVTGGE